MGSVLSECAGHEDLSEKALASLGANSKFAEEMDNRLSVFGVDDGARVVYRPDMVRIRKVITKNARGHVMYEHGQRVAGDPEPCNIAPLLSLPERLRGEFEFIDYGSGWPECGSRLMQRLVTGDDMRPDGWIEVQPGVYRYAVMESDGFIVRSVIREYLATEVIFAD